MTTSSVRIATMLSFRAKAMMATVALRMPSLFRAREARLMPRKGRNMGDLLLIGNEKAPETMKSGVLLVQF
jgi:hypothetical protein